MNGFIYEGINIYTITLILIKALQAGQSGDQILVGGGGISTPVPSSSEAHPAYCTMGTGSFLGVKQLGRGVDHPPPTSAEV
jgi:hypothetical protein